MRMVVDMMLTADDPYEALEAGTAAPRPQLRLVQKARASLKLYF